MIGVDIAILATSLAASAAPVEDSDVFAACLVRYHSREVTIALDSGFDDKFASAIAAISTKKCDTSNARPEPPVLRGPLFAAMYRKYGPKAGRSASNIATHWRPNLLATDQRSGWYSVSDCLVTKAPDATRRLIAADPGSEARKVQFGKVVEKLPECLPAGMEFHVSKSTLTGLIAETIYQIDFAVTPGERRWWL